jgi:hypothetical protein
MKGSTYWSAEGSDERCAGIVRNGYRQHTYGEAPYRCQYVGNNGHDGGWYCRLHWPPAVRQRAEKMRDTLVRQMTARIHGVAAGLGMDVDAVLSDVVTRAQKILCGAISQRGEAHEDKKQHTLSHRRTQEDR